MKKTLTLVGSACWFLFAVGFAALLVRYIAQGAGLQFSAWLFSDSSLVIGMVHVLGLVFASLICVAISAALWVRTFASAEQRRDGAELQKDE